MKALLLAAQEAKAEPQAAADDVWAKLKDTFGK
jgi:hypothetical protein